MRVPRKAIVLLLLLTLFCTSYACALEVPERPQGRVTDLTDTLSADEVSQLERKLADYEEHTTNQIAVLLIPSLKGDNLEDYSIRLADKWKIGQAGKDNGVILLIAKYDRKIRIEVGYGLESVLPDGLAGAIIRDQIGPFFKRGDFFGGVNQGLNAIIKVTDPGFVPIEPQVVGKPNAPAPDYPWYVTLPGLAVFFWWVPVVAVVLIIAAIAYWRKEDWASYRNTGTGGFGTSFSDDGYGGFSSGGFSGGGGGFGGGGASGGW